MMCFHVWMFGFLILRVLLQSDWKRRLCRLADHGLDPCLNFTSASGHALIGHREGMFWIAHAVHSARGTVAAALTADEDECSENGEAQ